MGRGERSVELCNEGRSVMGQTVSVARESASEVAAANRTEFRPVEIVAEIRKWFPGLSKKLSREKPSATVHFLVGGDAFAKVRTVYDWCAGKFDPPAMAIIKLLHTDAGWIVLEYLMRGCKASWWVEVQRAKRCAAAYEQAREQLELSLEVAP